MHRCGSPFQLETTNSPCSFVLAHPAHTAVAEASSSFSGCSLGQKLATLARSSTHDTSALSMPSAEKANTYKLPQKFDGKLERLFLDLHIFPTLAASPRAVHSSLRSGYHHTAYVPQSALPSFLLTSCLWQRRSKTVRGGENTCLQDEFFFAFVCENSQSLHINF